MLKQTPRLTSIANIALFRLFNRDLFGNLNNLYRTVTRTRGPVVLHFHVLHSYWLNLEEVVAFCGKVKAHKPDTRFVWTLHDHWSVTGRCAFTDGCEGWKDNCQKCPTLSNYPPVKIDRAHRWLRVSVSCSAICSRSAAPLSPQASTWRTLLIACTEQGAARSSTTVLMWRRKRSRRTDARSRYPR